MQAKFLEIKNKFKRKFLDKKGMSTLEFAICLMMFIIIFTFLADVFLIIYKQYAVTSATSEISRQIGVQGGIAPQIPENYPGLEKNYLSYKELNKWVSDINNSYFKEDGEAYVLITYYKDPNDPTTKVTIDPRTANEAIYLPYGSYLSVTTYYPVRWTYWLSWFGGDDGENMASVTKDYITEYVSWVPEDYTNLD